MGWVQVVHNNAWFTSDGEEIRYITRDCEFRNREGAQVYLANGYEKSPIWNAAQHWEKVGRVTLMRDIG
jgi:hypothetical protein